MRLRDKIAFVTGAGSGIGRAGAIAMAREGARVIVSDLDGEVAGSVAAEITRAGSAATGLELDVTDDTALTAAIDAAARDFGRLDVLHSHAGVQVEGTLEEVDPVGMDLSWALNVRAHFIAARAAVPHMKAQGGGSVIGKCCHPTIGAKPLIHVVFKCVGNNRGIVEFAGLDRTDCCAVEFFIFVLDCLKFAVSNLNCLGKIFKSFTN